MKIKTIFAGIGGVVSVLFGAPDAMLIALIFCICADYITGLLAAAYRRKLNSKTGFRGILKKLMILILVALAHVVGQMIQTPALRDVICAFYIANESLSILENAAAMDVPYSGKLKKLLEQLREKE